MAHVLSRLQELLGHIGIGGTAQIVPKYRYLPVWLPHGNAMAGTYVSMGGGAAAMTEVGTSGIGGLRFEATTDDIAFPVLFPDDVDVEREIGLCVLWSSDQTTTADDFVWAINYREVAINSTVALSAPATALSTQVASDANLATASAMQQTAWGTIDASTFNGTFADGYMHTFEIDPTTLEGTPSSDVVTVYAAVIRYYPKRI